MRTILMAAVLLSGCSWTLQDKPSRGPAVSASCSGSRVLPVLDTVAAVAAIGLTVATMVKADEWNDGGSVAGGAGVLGAVVLGGSAETGYSNASECRANRPTTAVARGE